MKTYLVVNGSVIAGLALLTEANSPGRFDVPPGLFWVAAASLISAALWSPSNREGSYHLYASAIYAQLAKEPISMETLLEKIAGGSIGEQVELLSKKTVVTMLDEGNLVIVDGLVSLARVNSASDRKSQD